MKLSAYHRLISLTSLLLISLFFVWLTLTFVPVAIVEAKYQVRRFMTEVLHVHSVKEFLIPDFKYLGFRGDSRNKTYGISIPTIYLDEPVVFNVDPNDKVAYTAALKTGIAHASGTAFPDNGGVGYYFAHSSNPELRQQFNAVFYLLGKLEVGDEIFLWHEGKDFEYEVFATRITSPDDVSFLAEQYGDETIILQTCWPPGTTEQRLLVLARRVE